jgi:hypothetical protein
MTGYTQLAGFVVDDCQPRMRFWPGNGRQFSEY